MLILLQKKLSNTSFARQWWFKTKLWPISCIIWWKRLNPFWQIKHSVAILPMYQLHTSALLDIRVATKDQTEGHNGLQEIHLHLKLPSFLTESSTSFEKGGGESATAHLTQHYVPRMTISSRWGTSNVIWLSLAIFHVSMTHLSTTWERKLAT
jgi:hypothetical protein